MWPLVVLFVYYWIVRRRLDTLYSLMTNLKGFICCLNNKKDFSWHCSLSYRTEFVITIIVINKSITNFPFSSLSFQVSVLHVFSWKKERNIRCGKLSQKKSEKWGYTDRMNINRFSSFAQCTFSFINWSIRQFQKIS